jgi:hypothetical protein
MRTEETGRLKRAFDVATRRIEQYRKAFPAINDNDFGYYADGSSRCDFGSTGSSTVNYRMWTIGRLNDRYVYIYEEVDHRRRTSYDNYEDAGTHVYGLAIDDPNIGTYGGHRDGKASIHIDKLPDDRRFNIDMIVLMSDMLESFFATEASLRKAVRDFSERFNHRKSSEVFSR